MTDQTPSTPSTPDAPAAAAPLSEAEDRQWASFAHFGNIVLLIPALVIFLLFRKRGTRTGVESTEALNWTINVTGAYVILNILTLVPAIGFLFTVLGLILLVVNVVFAILGGVKVNGGGSYRYPVNIRWIK